jgi:hypothetical protein
MMMMMKGRRRRRHPAGIPQVPIRSR